MAKARDIPGLRPDMTYAEAAAATVRVRAQELFDHSDGVLDTGEIERVHAMRVASRRLRAVLEIHAACFEPGHLRPVLRDVKSLADALGCRRDPDVQLASIEAFAAELGEPEQPGIALFAQQLRTEQAQGNTVLAAALAEIERSDLAGRLQALADSASGQAPESEPPAAEAPVATVERPGTEVEPEALATSTALATLAPPAAPARRGGLLRFLRRSR